MKCYIELKRYYNANIFKMFTNIHSQKYLEIFLRKTLLMKNNTKKPMI